MMNHINIAEFILHVRKEQGLTQKELGDRLGVTAQAVSKWERGENFPDTELLLTIARTFDMSVDDLLRGKSNSVRQSKSALKETRFLIAAVLILFSIGYGYYTGIEGILNGIIVGVSFVLGSIILVFTIRQKDLRRSNLDNVSKGAYIIALVVFLVFGLYFGVLYISWLAFPLAYAILLIFHHKNES